MNKSYDLIVIGAGSGGITAAQFAARLGVKVALIEKNRIGGDCTWTGCVPSKALLKAAKMAQALRSAHDYGIGVSGLPQIDMSKVCEYISQTIADVYKHETPEHLASEGIEVIIGTARFLNDRTIQVAPPATDNGLSVDGALSASSVLTLTSKKFIIATGAHPFIPPISGLSDVRYLTYLEIFENDRLPERLIVIGAGPIGSEIAQAYQRLGSRVTLIDIGLLPQEEPEVAEVMKRVFAREGLDFVEGLVSAACQRDNEITVKVNGMEFQGDMLLVAVGRAPVINGLDLDKAGIAYSQKGIPVDKNLRTNLKHIYAVGDCIAGNYQFTHLAGWQGFQAVRNALLPLSHEGFLAAMPWTTFTEPEVAHVGLTEAEARDNFGNEARVRRWDLERVDRAVVENDTEGFIKVIYKKNGKVLGATIVAERAGEMITEYTLAIQQGLKLFDLAKIMHVYPTYSMGTMRLAAAVTTETVMDGLMGKTLRFLAGKL